MLEFPISVAAEHNVDVGTNEVRVPYMNTPYSIIPSIDVNDETPRNMYNYVVISVRLGYLFKFTYWFPITHSNKHWSIYICQTKNIDSAQDGLLRCLSNNNEKFFINTTLGAIGRIL